MCRITVPSTWRSSPDGTVTRSKSLKESTERYEQETTVQMLRWTRSPIQAELLRSLEEGGEYRFYHLTLLLFTIKLPERTVYGHYVHIFSPFQLNPIQLGFSSLLSLPAKPFDYLLLQGLYMTSRVCCQNKIIKSHINTSANLTTSFLTHFLLLASGALSLASSFLFVYFGSSSF